MAALALFACAPHSALGPDVEHRHYELSDGFLHVDVSIPQVPAGRKPAVIGSLGADELLLARGIIVVRFRNDWAALGRAAELAHREQDGPEPPPDTLAPPGSPGSLEPPNRVGAWALAAPRPGIVGRSYFALIGATAEKTVPAVVDLLAGLSEVDPDRIAIAGSSTHGFVALEALRVERRLAAGVVRVACGDYHGFLRSSSLALNDEPRWLPEGDLVLDADYDRALTSQEPIRFADHYPPRPLLMLNGATDPAIPVECAKRTAAALEVAYREAGASDRFRFVVFDDAGHDLGSRDTAEVLAWWERWLQRGD